MRTSVKVLLLRCKCAVSLPSREETCISLLRIVIAHSTGNLERAAKSINFMHCDERCTVAGYSDVLLVRVKTIAIGREGQSTQHTDIRTKKEK